MQIFSFPIVLAVFDGIPRAEDSDIESEYNLGV